MKYAALLLNGLAVLLLGWGLYGVVQLARTHGPAVRPVTLELAPLAAALQTEQARVADALGAMSRLQAQATSQQGREAQPLLALPAPGSELVGSVQMPARALSVHLDNLSTESQTVVIDGQLVQRGSRLGDGGRVTRVRPHEAVVTEQLGRQTLTLPVNELRVGTLRWADGTPASVNTQEFRAGLPGSQPAAIRSLP